MELLSPGHLIPLLIIAGILFFGWKQLPDMARSAGRSLRVFRTEVKGMADDDAMRETKSALTSATDTPAIPYQAAPFPGTAPAAAPQSPLPSASPTPTVPPAVAPSSATDVTASDAPGPTTG